MFEVDIELTLNFALDLPPKPWMGGGCPRVPKSLATTVLGRRRRSKNPLLGDKVIVYTTVAKDKPSDTCREFPELTTQSKTLLESIAKRSANICSCFCLKCV